VTANVFSSILQGAAPAIARAVAPGGCLIISGILRVQEKETLAAFTSERLRVGEISRRGKWVTARLRAPGA
jgi:ribosomal protein L11 methyltransferase